MKLIFNSEEINDIFATGLNELGLTNIDRKSVVVEIKQTRGEGGDTYANVEFSKKVVEDINCPVKREFDMPEIAPCGNKPHIAGDNIPAEQEVYISDEAKLSSDDVIEDDNIKPESSKPLSNIFNN